MMPLGEIESQLMRADIDWLDGAGRPDSCENFPDAGEFQCKLALCDRNKLIEDLDANDPARNEELLSPARLRRITR